MSYSVWWKGLPRWLKLVYLLAALPAWLFIVFCVVTGRNKGPAALAAFGLFTIAALLHIVFDRRPRGIDREAGGVDFFGGDS